MSTGLSGDRIVGRICVEHRATPGPPPTVDVAEVECPETLLSSTGNAGNVDFLVRLDP
jgi:hypothetical protein